LRAFFGFLCVITVFKIHLTYPHSYLYESSLRYPFLLIGTPFEYYSQICLRLFKRSRHFMFPHKKFCLFLFSVRATFLAHVTHLDVIILVIFVDWNKLRSSSLCSLLHYRLSSSYKSRYLFQHPVRENP
jgi:hypothetical protein